MGGSPQPGEVWVAVTPQIKAGGLGAAALPVGRLLCTVCWEQNIVFGGFAAFGGKAKNQSFPEQVWFFSLGTPGLQKNTWANKAHSGIKPPGESAANDLAGTNPRHCA